MDNLKNEIFIENIDKKNKYNIIYHLNTLRTWSLDSRFDILNRKYKLSYLSSTPYQQKTIRRMLANKEEINRIEEYIDLCKKCSTKYSAKKLVPIVTN